MNSKNINDSVVVHDCVRDGVFADSLATLQHHYKKWTSGLDTSDSIFFFLKQRESSKRESI